MESLFFNLDNKKYKKSRIKQGITRVDISQGLLYFDVRSAKEKRDFELDFIDKMAIVFVVKDGSVSVKSPNDESFLEKENIYIFSLNGQKIDFTFSAKSEVFVLFIADFFLKNYLSEDENSPINLLYNTLQKDSKVQELCSCILDERSRYLVNDLLDIDEKIPLLSLKAELLSLEVVVHFLQMLKVHRDGFDPLELKLATRAKELLSKEFVNPPTIKELAKLCHTNETKLKKTFKKVYSSTIYAYVQDLRLERAYYLLKEKGVSVGEASKSVGYLHQGNFSKLFQEKMGVKPSLINKIPFVAK